MEYDFTTYYDRRRNGSGKWLMMNQMNKNPMEGVIPMTTADMDFPTCPEIVEALKKYITSEVLGYSNPTAEYFQSVKKFLQERYGYTVEQDWLITTPGIVYALALSIKALTDENDGVILMSPVYHHFYEVIEMQNREIWDCPLTFKNNRYYINFELFENIAKKSHVKMFLLCSPHNPGGRVWSIEELQKIISICLKNNVMIVSDEIHADITLKNKKHYILTTIDEAVKDQSIICTSASKTFNLAGLQCSNIFISNKEMRDKFIYANTSLGMKRANVLGLVATKAAYDFGLNWFNEMLELVEHHQDLVTKFFQELSPKFQVMGADASFLAWINYQDLEVDNKEFIQFLAEECNFYVNDGEMFGKNAKYFFRINVGMPTEQLKQNLKRFEQKVKERYLQ